MPVNKIIISGRFTNIDQNPIMFNGIEGHRGSFQSIYKYKDKITAETNFTFIPSTIINQVTPNNLTLEGKIVSSEKDKSMKIIYVKEVHLD